MGFNALGRLSTSCMIL